MCPPHEETCFSRSNGNAEESYVVALRGTPTI